MPEYPDIVIYIEALEQRILGKTLQGVSLKSPFLLRTVKPPIDRFVNKEDVELERLYEATKTTLIDWTQKLRKHYGNKFPERVTAFRESMAVHGRYNQPCPVCNSPIQRIRYTANETNYCPACQTGGRILADRALSRLLKKDWPRTLDELEKMKRTRS